MANPEHLEILKQGVEAWNKWRREHPNVHPDLSDADLIGANLYGADLIAANLVNVNLRETYLRGAEIAFSFLGRANLIGADLTDADLRYADFSGAKLINADLTYADLSHASLSGADFTDARLDFTTLADTDLSEVKGLETVRHVGPSSIGVDTLYNSAGKIPEAFLRGCGIPDDFIAFIPSHFGVQQAIQFYSCFISYSTQDEEFARRLYSRMRDEKLRVWFAPEDVKGGEKLYEQIERAIQVHDRLLIVLSERSLQSKWVMTEIRRARKVELRENRRKLFPIRLVDYETLQAWECFDADTGEDLASEVRQYFIPDFSNWKEHDAFEKAFERLLRDLRAEEKRA
ncbi:MAG: toll/interleukin-1 receptor domain-containing protein [Acidobacteriota bacterium]|nr:toll/interleukin-1 receptor domain-containing protein [Acidobacteriota bacterium]MDQ5835748.1 toll/interleukin-1 receptor domain-containing protein [Acidobacteriota bacterium]